jgi:hypothetical protein
MARIDKVNPQETEKRIRAVLEAQAKKWGAPLLNHLVYARPYSRARGRCGAGLPPPVSSTPRSSRSSTEGSPPSTAANSDRI